MPPDSLLRPLPIDIIYFLLPLVVGLAAFFVGRLFNRWSILVRAGLVGLTFGAICITFALLLRAIPRPVDLAFSYAGGVIVVLCWMILGVIGFSWTAPTPSSDFLFRVALAVVPLGLIGIESGGSLWYRYHNTEVWQNRPRTHGLMAQSTTSTCLPASAAMLLHQYGITNVSEGECAYLANTSYFGTDGHVMARVITEKIGKPDVRARMINTNYQEMIEHRAPFIAQVQNPNVGHHAILVLQCTPFQVRWVDPLEPLVNHTHPPQELEDIWTGSAIVITGKMPGDNVKQ